MTDIAPPAALPANRCQPGHHDLVSREWNPNVSTCTVCPTIVLHGLDGVTLGLTAHQEHRGVMAIGFDEDIVELYPLDGLGVCLTDREFRVGEQVWFRGHASHDVYIGEVIDYLFDPDRVRPQVLVRPLLQHLHHSGRVIDCTRWSGWTQWCGAHEVVRL